MILNTLVLEVIYRMDEKRYHFCFFRNKKTKLVFYSILTASLLIIFPVLSGVLIGTLTVLTGKDYQVAGIFIQAFFMLVPILMMGIYLKKQRISLPSLDLVFKPSRSYLLFFPCILIYLPLLFEPFYWKGTSYFVGNLFLYTIVGIVEELYFRGVIPNILKQGFGKYGVILIAALIFGLGHSSLAFSGADFKIVLFSILNALIFGWLAMELKYLTNNITILMLMHFLFNFQSKFVSVTNTELLYREILRGTIMIAYAILLFMVMKKKDSKAHAYQTRGLNR